MFQHSTQGPCTRGQTLLETSAKTASLGYLFHMIIMS